MRGLTDDQILMMAYYIVCPSNDFMRSRGVNVADGTRVGWYCKYLLKDGHVGTMSNAHSDQSIEWYAEHRDPNDVIRNLSWTFATPYRDAIIEIKPENFDESMEHIEDQGKVLLGEKKLPPVEMKSMDRPWSDGPAITSAVEE